MEAKERFTITVDKPKPFDTFNYEGTVNGAKEYAAFLSKIGYKTISVKKKQGK